MCCDAAGTDCCLVRATGCGVKVRTLFSIPTIEIEKARNLVWLDPAGISAGVFTCSGLFSGNAVWRGPPVLLTENRPEGIGIIG
jgi:hypothetical protein